MGLRRKGVIGLVLLGLSLQGCAQVSRQAKSFERTSNLKQLTVGMPRQKVEQLFGKPFNQEQWGTTTFLMYETNYLALRNSGRYTAIAIVDGKVAGWGKEYYTQLTKSRKNWDTLTQGR